MPTRNLSKAYALGLTYTGSEVADPVSGAKTGLIAKCADSEFDDPHDGLHLGGRHADLFISKWLDTCKQQVKRLKLPGNPVTKVVEGFRIMSKPTLHINLVERKTTGQLTLGTQLGFTFFRTMETNNWKALCDEMKSELERVGTPSQVKAFEAYRVFYRWALLPFVLEDRQAFKEAAFWAPLYSHLLLSLHILIFGKATPSLRNLASDMARHLNDFARMGLTARGAGAEGCESGVPIRRDIQDHLNGLLGGRHSDPREREAAMLMKKLIMAVWKASVAPTVAPQTLGAVKRQQRAAKRIAKQQGSIERLPVPPIGFQRRLPLGPLRPATLAADQSLGLLGDSFLVADAKVKAVVSELSNVDEDHENHHVRGFGLSVGGAPCESPRLLMSLYTSQAGGWDKVVVKDEAKKKAGFRFRSFEVNQHALVDEGGGGVTLHLQFKRAPTALVEGVALEGSALNQILETDKYRNVCVTGGNTLRVAWQAWCEVWSLDSTRAKGNVRSTFRANETFSAQGHDALQSVLEFVAAQKDKTLPIVTMTASELDAGVGNLLKVEKLARSGEASPLVHCMFCREGLALLDLRPSSPVLRWCSVKTGEPHDFCTELRTWAGTAGEADDGGEDDDQEEFER